MKEETTPRSEHRWEDNIRIDIREIHGKVWTGFIWLRQGPVVSCCEHGNEPSVFS
jgi:hypothetical protein